MTNQEIVDYVINTPNNTNPVILKQMLKDITGSENLELDTTLSVAGKAADAKAVGDAISKLSGGNGGVISWNKLTDRPFGTYPPEYELQWDGDMTGRTVIDLTPLGFDGGYMVKVSDRIYIQEELRSKYLILSTGDATQINSDSFSQALPGSFNVNDMEMTIVYSASETNAAFGAPDGYITNGTYFAYVQGGGFVSGIATKPGYVEKMDVRYMPGLRSYPNMYAPMMDGDRGFWYLDIDSEYYDELWNTIKENNFVMMNFMGGSYQVFIPLSHDTNSDTFYGRALLSPELVSGEECIELFVKIQRDVVHYVKKPTGISFDL